MPSRPQGVSTDEIRARIRGAGLRTTPSRVAVLARLALAPTPLSHAEVTEDLSAHGWDRATLYRNLADLTEAGLLKRTDLGDHVWRYELRGTAPAGPAALGNVGEEHPHFMCATCGEVRCLPDLKVEFRAGSETDRSLTARPVEVQLKGLCDRCA